MKHIRRPALIVSIALVSVLASLVGFQLNASGNDIAAPSGNYMDVQF